MATYYRIKRGDGMGGFLCPPGHPNLTHEVQEMAGNHRVTGMMALDTAATTDYVSEGVRRAAQRMLDNATLRESDGWVRMVYGYFRNMYRPEGGSADVSNLVHDPSNSLPVDRHAAVAFIRQYFPEHVARVDLITDPGNGYGSHPCVKCGKRVQYEACVDKLCNVEFGCTVTRYGVLCIDGQGHTL